MRVSVFDDPDQLADGAAASIAETMSSLGGRRASLGLAGGSTPRPVYERLRWMALPWDRIDLWLSDERWVPWDDEGSNGLMVAEALADHVPASFHRPRWSEHLEARDSAAFYDATLRRIFHEGSADLVLLGMGGDGHTASLFPGTEALDAPEGRLYVENRVPAIDAWRLTATAALITAARAVTVIVTGESKAPVVRAVLDEEGAGYPIEVVRRAASVHWMLDAAAASLLSGV